MVLQKITSTSLVRRSLLVGHASCMRFLKQVTLIEQAIPITYGLMFLLEFIL